MKDLNKKIAVVTGGAGGIGKSIVRQLLKEGSKVAMVGASGCGKSTIMQMLLRFYAPTKGSISINGISIKDFDIHYLRKSFGVVSQEPALFAGSFKDNIKYNLE